MNSGYGLLEMIRSHIQLPVMGKVLIVAPTSDANYNRLFQMVREDNTGDGTSIRLYNTLEAAYAAATSNANDVIALSGNATHAVSTGIAWAKSRIHVIGFDGGHRLVQQGAKIELTGAVDSAYVIKNTGVRNSFRNVKVIQSSTHANAKSIFQFGGEGNLYENVSAIFGVNNNLGSTTTFEVINGEDSGTFIDCTWGSDVLLTTAARAVMSLDIVTAGQECKSNIYVRNNYIISSSSSTATFIRTSATTDILFTNLWIDPTFQASVDSAGGVALAEAVQTGTGVTKGTLNFVRPAAFNVTDFATATGGRNAGVQVVAAVSVAAAVEGITPTA